jgi:large subunit ribosomal protein L15
VNMQTSLALLQSPVPVKAGESQDNREPYKHPALEGLPNLSNTSIDHSLGKKRLASLATQMGMVDIIRWVPRLVSACFGQLLLGCLFWMEILTVLRRGMI